MNLRLKNLRDALVQKYGTRVRKEYPIGAVFNRLTVIGYERQANGIWAVLCMCACGRKKKVRYPNQMRRNLVKSCGCLNKELCSERAKGRPPVWKLPPGVAAFNAVFRIYRRGATLRDLEFLLTEQEFKALATASCHYCGAPPANVSRYDGYNGVFTYNGIDRVDTAKGYTVSNCVPSCKTCNRAKRDIPYAEFIAWIKRAADHLAKVRTVVTV